MDKIQKLLQLKQKRNAIILAHYYQDPDIQDVADASYHKMYCIHNTTYIQL